MTNKEQGLELLKKASELLSDVQDCRRYNEHIDWARCNELENNINSYLDKNK